MEILFHPIEEGVIFNVGDFIVSAFPVSHRGPDCYGFLFDEKSRRPFLPERAEALTVPPGPWRRDLVNGQEVVLPDGRLILPDQVLGPERPGTRLVLVGDVGRTDGLAEYCKEADALIIEATYLKEDAQLAEEYAHLTAKQAGELAIRAGVKNLILTHVSRRYRERDILSEARAVFPGAIVARDFDDFLLKRSKLIKIEKTEWGPE
jgi:ribonuclease Z